jgi:hypothetical protein
VPTGKLWIALVIGFAGGFVLQPIISPTQVTTAALTASREARSTHYFEANIDEARQVVAACRNGTIRDNECASAETAIITVESKERFNRFRTEK